MSRLTLRQRIRYRRYVAEMVRRRREAGHPTSDAKLAEYEREARALAQRPRKRKGKHGE